MLYEIAADYINFLEAIENGDIPEEAIEDTLEAIKSSFEEKSDSIACLIKNLDAEISAIKAEETRLADRRKAKERQKERIKSYLESTLLLAGVDKIETARNRITFRKSEAVTVDENFIEWAKANRDDLLTFAEPTPNKTEIKKALKEGAEIVGAELRVNNNIQIK